MKDSVLLANNVKKVEDLPFNYGGFIMAKGEALSTAIYLEHQERLYQVYTKQNNLERYSAFVNPYTAIKNLSMAFSGTDFQSFLHFKSKAEAYRFKLAQEMNKLQMDFIPNKGKEGPNTISNKYWKEFPPFEYHFMSIIKVFKNELISILALFLWSLLTIFGLLRLSNNLKAI